MTDPPRPRPSRRDFLQGKAAADAVAQWVAADSTGQPTPSPPPSYTLQIARRAMATEFQILLNAREDPQAAAAALAALDRVEELEDQLSVYRPGSELSRLNAAAYETPVAVEFRLFELLQRSLELWRLTAGAFDVTAGPLSKVWGFHHRQGRWPNEEELQQARRTVGCDSLLLEPEQQTVAYLTEGLEINLGAIGKGFALDESAEILIEAGLENFLIVGGLSSVLARGARRGDDAWPVGLRHPLKPQQRLATLRLDNRALGTSGCGNQFFHHQGKRLSHILDPRTGMPAEGVLSATVLAPRAADADALATAAYVLGPKGMAPLLDGRPDWAAVFVVPKTGGSGIDIVSFNLEGSLQLE